MSDHVAGNLGEPSSILDEDAEDADEWPARAVRRGLSVRAPMAVLLALLVAAGAFWGGAAVQKSREGSSGGVASALRSLFAGRSGASASGEGGLFGGSGGASGPAATGTLTVVEGSTLYVTEPSGTIVKVVLAPSATVTRDSTTTLSRLRPGDTVVVEGATGKDGTVTASSVAATAPGVPASGGGGFLGFGGTAGGSGGTSSGSGSAGSGGRSGSGGAGSGGGSPGSGSSARHSG